MNNMKQRYREALAERDRLREALAVLYGAFGDIAFDRARRSQPQTEPGVRP